MGDRHREDRVPRTGTYRPPNRNIRTCIHAYRKSLASVNRTSGDMSTGFRSDGVLSSRRSGVLLLWLFLLHGYGSGAAVVLSQVVLARSTSHVTA